LLLQRQVVLLLINVTFALGLYIAHFRRHKDSRFFVERVMGKKW
jgi:hypothetical protein